MKQVTIAIMVACACLVAPGGCMFRRGPQCTHIHCINTLRMIAAAKDICAQEYGWTNGTPCDTPENRTKIEERIKPSFLPPYSDLKCPQCRRIRCTYHYNPIGVAPSCALGDPKREFVKTGLWRREPTSRHRMSEDEMRREQLASPYSVTRADDAAPGAGEP